MPTTSPPFVPIRNRPTGPSAASELIAICQAAPNNRWDLATTAAWLEHTTPRVFRDHRHVIINDSGSNTPSLDLLGILQPGFISISNTTKAYTLGGTGSISGTTGLTKSGTNTLTLASPNTYTGATAIDVGVVEIQHATALGSPTGGTSVAPNARLELTGGITVTGEPLAIAGRGGASYFYGALNSQSGTNTWAGPVTITDVGTRIGAMAGATLAVSGPIDSAGQSHGLTIRPFDASSTVILAGPNTWLGDTWLVGGLVKASAPRTLPATTVLRLGLSNVSGKLDLAGHHQQVAGLTVAQTSGTFANEITSAVPATLTIEQTTALSYSGKITGSVTLAKSGTGTLTLTSTATLAPGVSVMVDGGALGLASSHTISALRIRGTWQPPGVYNSSNSSGYITGAGSLTVTSSGPSGFDQWIDSFPGFSPSEKLATADPDADGVNNFLEYVLAGIPDEGNSAILSTVSITPTHFVFTFTRREDSASHTTQVFEYGSSLESWTPLNITAPTGPEVSLGAPSGGLREVSVSIPLTAAPDGRLFGRLSVVQP